MKTCGTLPQNFSGLRPKWACLKKGAQTIVLFKQWYPQNIHTQHIRPRPRVLTSPTLHAFRPIFWGQAAVARSPACPRRCHGRTGSTGPPAHQHLRSSPTDSDCPRPKKTRALKCPADFHGKKRASVFWLVEFTRGNPSQ